MAAFELTEGMRKAFLAGFGVEMLDIERERELIEGLVAAGELSSEQGEALVAELETRRGA